MKYRNTITGVVVEVNSKLKGVWEPVEAPKSPIEEDKPKASKPKTRKKKGA